MENYVCLKCRFKFKSGQNPKTCPYCDRPSIQKEQGAEDMLSEVESLLSE